MENNSTAFVQQEVIYQAGSPLRSPGVLVRTIARDLVASRELAWRLFVRNINARYRQTALGYFWAIFPPLATTAIWLFLTRQNVVTIESGSVPYPVFLVTGTVLWQIFADAIQIPIRVITQSKQMLAKINFPREALVITAFGESLFNFGIRLGILIVAYLILGFTPAVSVPMAFIGVFAVICLGLAIGLLLSPFALLYEDVANGLTLFIQMWMYATPVIYAPKSTGLMGWVNTVNPISPVLCQTRDWVLTGEWTYFASSTLVFAGTLFFIAVGFVIYRVALPRAIERLSS
tara:strand:- start:14798 stop:15667 length:870 start_codon:yes stop_codon:yes gene_type:complete